MRKLHDVYAASLGSGSKIGGVTEHFRQRNESTDNLGAGLGVIPSILPVVNDVTYYISMYSSGTVISTFITGSSNAGSPFQYLHSQDPAILNAISEVYFMIRAVHQSGTDIDCRIASQYTAFSASCIPLSTGWIYSWEQRRLQSCLQIHNRCPVP